VSALLATLALTLLCGAGFALLSAAAAALAWRLFRGPIERAHPVWRARIAFVLAVAPALLPALVLTLVLAPGFAGALGFAPDHCLAHGGHVHLCFAHPHAALTLPLAAWLALCAGAFGVTALRRARRLAGWRRQLASFRSAASERLAPGVRLIPSARPFSVTVGLLRPEIWISTALRAQLDQEALEAVLAHERAHRRRRDALRRVLAHALSRPHWPGVRRALLAQLSLASEQACDEAAARSTGDRLQVAETLLAVERLLSNAPAFEHPAWASFGGGELAARVHRLVEAQGAEPEAVSLWLWFAAAVVVCALAQPLHHATEHALGWLLRTL
jgi:Zn-dependent protease with chaperone function